MCRCDVRGLGDENLISRFKCYANYQDLLNIIVESFTFV